MLNNQLNNTLGVKKLGVIYIYIINVFFFGGGFSYAHKGCIYLIKNTVNIVKYYYNLTVYYSNICFEM